MAGILIADCAADADAELVDLCALSRLRTPAHADERTWWAIGR
jgi:hypothetical protein